MIEVTYNGKTLTGNEIAGGVVQRATRANAKTFLVQCMVTGEWKYCSAERYQKLLDKHGTPQDVGASYLSREGARIQKSREQGVLDTPVQGPETGDVGEIVLGVDEVQTPAEVEDSVDAQSASTNITQ